MDRENANRTVLLLACLLLLLICFMEMTSPQSISKRAKTGKSLFRGKPIFKEVR